MLCCVVWCCGEEKCLAWRCRLREGSVVASALSRQPGSSLLRPDGSFGGVGGGGKGKYVPHFGPVDSVIVHWQFNVLVGGSPY